MSGDKSQRDLQLAAYFAGNLDQAGQAALESEIRTDQALAREVAALAVTERLLRLACAPSGEETFAREVLSRVRTRSSGRAFADQVVRRVRDKALKRDLRSQRHAARRGAARPSHSLPHPGAGWVAAAAAFVLAVLGVYLMANSSSPTPPRTAQNRFDQRGRTEPEPRRKDDVLQNTSTV